MTPRKLHWFWQGDNPPPWPKDWPEVAHNYEIYMWNIATLKMAAQPDWDLPDGLHVVTYSELCRHIVIYRYGGIYLDADVVLLKSPDSLLMCGTFVGVESPPTFANAAVSGGESGQAFNRDMVEKILAAPADLTPAERGPQLLTKHLERRFGVKLRHDRYIPNDYCSTVPKAWVYPYNWNEKPLKDYPPETICVHLWDKRW